MSKPLRLLQHSRLLSFGALICSLMATDGDHRLSRDTALGLAEASKHLARGDLDLLLRGLHLPDGNGLQLIEVIHPLYPGLSVVILSLSEPVSDQLLLVQAGLAKSRTHTQHCLDILARLLPAKETNHA